jgi:guanine nucleotide exchange factor
MQYLACADCEVGPIGWHDPTQPKEFFVAHERVAFRS